MGWHKWTPYGIYTDIYNDSHKIVEEICEYCDKFRNRFISAREAEAIKKPWHQN